MNKTSEPAPQPTRGVFWVIDGKLHAYPFREDSIVGVAKSGNTYNHKLLWETLGLSKRPYNYYPRGRVEIRERGRAVIFMNPNIACEPYISQIKSAFGIEGCECRIKADFSEHYQCHLDDGYSSSIQ